MKTPSQQALIQFIESILLTALIAGIVSISTTVTGTGPVNWKDVGIAFGVAFALSLAHSLVAYLKAQPAQAAQNGQPAIDLANLGMALEGLVNAFQQKIQAIPTHPVQTQQVAQAPQGVQQPVAPAVQSVRPASATPASMPSVQAQSGVQQSIPAFTATAQYAAVQPNQPAQQ